MKSKSAITEPVQIGFLLIPQFSMMAFTAAVEPLRVANRLSEKTLYDWRLYSADGEPVPSSNGIALMPDSGLQDDSKVQILFICAGFDTEPWSTPVTLRWLRNQARRGIVMGAISTGTLLLAQAGLLKGYRSTTHWENLFSFTERYPVLEVTQNVYEIDRDRYTCSGGTAALDMMLYLIAREHGHELATAVSDQFIYDRVRTPGDQQRMAEQQVLLRQSPKLAAAVNVMANHIETPLTTTEIANRIGLSLRQLERLFHKYRGATPQRCYLELRLQQARRLLIQTGMSIMNVALATGFTSQSHFTKCYRETFAKTPQQERTGLLAD